MLWTLGIAFIVTVGMGVPITFCLGLSALAYFLQMGNLKMLMVIPHKMFGAIDSFPMLAVPFFILAGELMVASGTLDRLIRLSDLLVGRIRGGLAHVNIVSNMFMAGISGSAVADAAAIGGIMIPGMKQQGYDTKFSCGVTGAAATIGPIIPPSIAMVLYAMIYQHVTIAGLFITGVVPGAFMGFGLMIVSWFIAKKRNYPRIVEPWPLKKIFQVVRDSFFPLLMPLIIVGGIVGGVFTATEASCAAVIYALFLGFFVTRKLHLKDLPRIAVRASIVTSVVLMLFATGSVISWLIITHHIPELLGNWLQSVSANWTVFVTLVMIFLLIMGCLVDPGSSLIMFVPIFAPIAASYQMNPYHFAVMFVLNLQIGLLTPPVGLILFLMARLGDISLEEVVKGTWPFIITLIAIMGVMVYFPETIMWFPRLFGIGK
jgi:tripartite ATP-independent transporter DctM subunit